MIGENKQGKTIPDYLVDGELTEVKSITEETNNPNTIKKLIQKANRQIRDSGLNPDPTMKDSRSIGAVEIQLINKGSQSYQNLTVLEKIIQTQFHEHRSRSLHRVSIYRENNLILEFIRTPQNQIIRNFPKG
mgnify:CR=1 FL=1